MEKLVVYEDLGKYRKYLWACLAILPITIFLGLEGLSNAQRTLGWGAAGVLALGAVLLLRQVLGGRPKVVFEIDQTGITNTGWKMGHLPWNSIEGIEPWNYRGSALLAVRVAPHVKLPARQVAAAQMVGLAPDMLTLWFGGLSVDAAQALAFIASLKPEKVNR